MQVVYIAGNYRSNTINGIQNNIEIARKEATKWWARGYSVICPPMNSAMMDGICDDEIFLEGYKELLRRSDIVVMLPRWESSEGAKAEYKLAVELMKTIKMCKVSDKYGKIAYGGLKALNDTMTEIDKETVKLKKGLAR